MSNLLSSASLLLAVITVLYTVWQPDIRAERERKVDGQYPDLEPQHRALIQTLHWKSAPLVMASLLVFLAYVPIILKIAESVVRTARTMTLENALESYDPVQTTLVLVTIGFAGMTAICLADFFRLRARNMEYIKSKQEWEKSQ